MQAVLSTGDAEKFLWGRRDALKSALASLLKRKQVRSVQELLSSYETPGVCSYCLPVLSLQLVLTLFWLEVSLDNGKGFFYLLVFLSLILFPVQAIYGSLGAC